MFNKKFDKLVKDKPELFQYDFDIVEGKASVADEAAMPEHVRKALAEKLKQEK